MDFDLQRFSMNGILSSNLHRTTALQGAHKKYKIVCVSKRVFLLEPNGSVQAIGYNTSRTPQSSATYCFGGLTSSTSELMIPSRICPQENIVDIAASNFATYFLKNDGRVTVVGGEESQSRYIGLGTTYSTTTPIELQYEPIGSTTYQPLEDIVKIHGCAAGIACLDASGEVYVLRNSSVWKYAKRIPGGGDIVDIFTVDLNDPVIPETVVVYGITAAGTVKVCSCGTKVVLAGIDTSTNNLYKTQFVSVPGLTDVVKISGKTQTTSAAALIMFLSGDGSIKYVSSTDSTNLNVTKNESITSLPISISGETIVDIALSAYNLFMLTNYGNLYTIGNAYYNGLSTSKSSPTLYDTNVCMIASQMGCHAFAYMKSNGLIYGCGWKGSLGKYHGSATTVNSTYWATEPLLIPFQREVGCIDYYYSVALDEVGNPYLLGRNTNIWNEIDSTDHEKIWRRMPLQNIVKAVSAKWDTGATSGYYTTFFLGSDGNVYLTGYIGYITSTEYELVDSNYYVYRLKNISRVIDISAPSRGGMVLYMITDNGALYYLTSNSSYFRYNNITSSCTVKKVMAASKYTNSIVRVNSSGKSPYAVCVIRADGYTTINGSSVSAEFHDFSCDNYYFYGLNYETDKVYSCAYNSTTLSTSTVTNAKNTKFAADCIITANLELMTIRNWTSIGSNIVAASGQQNNTTDIYMDKLIECDTGALYRHKVYSDSSYAYVPFKTSSGTEIDYANFYRRPQQLNCAPSSGCISIKTINNDLLSWRYRTYTNTGIGISNIPIIGMRYHENLSDYFKVITGDGYSSGSSSTNASVYYLDVYGNVYGSGAAYWNGTSSAETSVKISFDTPIVDMVGGSGGALFLDMKGNVWGISPNAASTQYVIGQTTRSTTPVKVYSGGDARKIFITNNRSFIVTNNNKVYATGLGTNYGLGTGNTTNLTAYTELTDFSNVIKIVGSYRNTFFLCVDGSIWAVGLNSTIGTGSTSGTTTTIVKISGDNYFTDIAANYYGVCALTAEGQLWTCGMNAYIPLSSTSGTTTTLTKVTSPDVRFREIMMTYYGVIAISTNGLVYSMAYSAGYNGTSSANKGTMTILGTYEERPDFVTYNNSYIRDRCQEMYNSLPSDLKAVIALGQKPTFTSNRNSDGNECVAFLDDYIWIQSMKELGITSGPSTVENTKCATYSQYSSNANRIGYKQDGTTAVKYWTRSIPPLNIRNAFAISTSGTSASTGGNYSEALRYCFTIR